MDGMTISLKAVIDEASKRILFVEAGHDFVDILFSFLTVPTGKIVGLFHSQPPTMGSIGCMDNLYKSVENLDLNHFRSDTCKSMLLQPLNGAVRHCNRLKLKLDNGAGLTHYYCRSWACTSKVHREAASDSEGVFVKGLQRFVVSDELEVVPASSDASFDFLSKLHVVDCSAITERTFNIGLTEITNIMRFSMSSKTVLSRILLENKTMAESSGVNYFYTSSPIKPKQENHESKGDGNISVRLVVSKSKQMVCYAEAGEDFVNLLFSFLTVPLGYVLKEMGSSGGNGSQSQGCLSYLCNSVKELDADVMKSDELKDVLLNPKIPVGFAYENQLLGLKEVKLFYNMKSEATDLTIRDPKSSNEPGIKGVGFLKVAAMFTVTEDLKITPISPVTSLLMLNKLKVPLSDVGKLTVQIGREETGQKANTNEPGIKGVGFLKVAAMFTVTEDLKITPISPVTSLLMLNKLKVPLSDVGKLTVQIGREEASRLLVAAFLSEHALTDVFMSEILKDPLMYKQPKKETE
ncbi:hypothetical protein Tsubulata_037004 [Turnera subulata]|uniref:DUF674 family protein n=1 Tax=Turnera subulata TaxID=218843 RepID=A0A9Q0JAC0_9ROSI|nr:hypothetical protein Tsubulata_037004 [Turnera subulata]